MSTKNKNMKVKKKYRERMRPPNDYYTIKFANYMDPY